MSKGPSTPHTSPAYKNKLVSSLGPISVCTVLVMVFVMGLVKIYSADLGFHLRSAEMILKHKKFIYTDSFSYGSDGHPYYDMQWLYQLLVFFLYKMGNPVLVIINALLISFSIALTWFRFSKYPATIPENIRIIIFAFIALLFVLPLPFEIRPHVLSWIYLNLVLLALESYKRGKQRAVYFLPVIMLFWVNSHSLSILGLVTIGIYNLGIFFENKKIDKKLLLFSTIALAAFLINPYFFNGLLFPFRQFGLISGNGLVKSYIGEFHSPFAINEIEALGRYYFSNPLFLAHLSAVGVIICIVRSLFQKKFTDAFLLAVYLFLFSLASKNYGYYLMVSLPLIAWHITDWLGLRMMARQKETPAPKQKTNDKESSVIKAQAFNKKTYQGIAIATICLTILISITCINDGYTIFFQFHERFGFEEDKDQLPVEATDFLIKNNIRGKMLNHFNFGGYLMEHDSTKVFIDGRLELINDDFFSNYYSSITDENSAKTMLDTFKPDIIIFPYGGEVAWWHYLLSNKDASGYMPVYFDGLSVIYLKSSAFPQIPELTAQNVLKDIDINAAKKLGFLIRNSDKPDGGVVWLQSIWKKQVLPTDDVKKAIFCFANGFDTAALAYSAKALERSTVRIPDVIYTNLSVYYRQNKMYNEAQLCENKLE